MVWEVSVVVQNREIVQEDWNYRKDLDLHRFTREITCDKWILLIDKFGEDWLGVWNHTICQLDYGKKVLEDL